ncbi:MAG: c-type cytochrome [Bryobacteraceae bacterium]|nr:c-type cytochrome [Bryobacteraceae bacterium]
MPRHIIFLWAAALCAQDTEVRNPHTTAADVAQGAKTFRSHCSPCHGLNGEGGRGPNLSNGVFYHGSTDADLLRNISDGIAGSEMPGLFYSPDRVWQVVAYLRSLNAGSKPASKESIDAGARLFQSKGCAGCHRVNGEGGRSGPDLSEIGKTRSNEHLRQAMLEPDLDVRQRYWLVSATDAAGGSIIGHLMNEDTWSVQYIDSKGGLHSVSKAGLRGYKVEKRSTMPSYRGRVSDAELGQLIAYLSSLRPTGGSR